MRQTLYHFMATSVRATVRDMLELFLKSPTEAQRAEAKHLLQVLDADEEALAGRVVNFAEKEPPKSEDTRGD